MPLPQETFNTCDNRDVSTTSFTETEYAVLRRHGSVLVFPVLVLGLIGAGFFFIDPKLSELWQHQTLLGVCLGLGLFFWLFPSLRYFTNRYEITSNRVVIHKGLSGSKTEEVSWGEITGVSLSRGMLNWLRGSGNVKIHRENGTDLVLKEVPKAKRLVRDLESYLVQRQGMRK